MTLSRVFGCVLLAACSSSRPVPLPTSDCSLVPTPVPCTHWYAQRVVPDNAGRAWAVDTGFFLDGYTVPTVFLDPRDRMTMVASPLAGRGRLAVFRSTDGHTWTPATPLPTHQLPASCGTTFLDSTAQHLDDGRVRLLVEGWIAPTGQADPRASGPPQPGDDPGIRLCALVSSDGDTWTYDGQGPLLPADGTVWPSVPAAHRDPVSGEHTLFFADTYPGRDAVRRATSPDGRRFVPDTTETVLPERHVDPEPVYVAGTKRLRLYHTWDALTGELAMAESDDGGVSFGKPEKLVGLSGQVCHAPPEAPSPPDLCRLDPAFVALPDGTLHLYFSVFETQLNGTERRGIGRAVATDVSASGG